MRLFKLLISLSLSGAICLAPLACNAVNNEDSLELISGNPTNIAKKLTTQLTEAYLWQNDPLLQSYAKAKLRSKVPIAADGAMGDNMKDPSKVQVGWQRGAFDAIVFGASAGDRSVITKGISGYRWAFERQDPNGLFGESQYPEVISFLGSYARSIILLRQAGYSVEAESLSQYIPQMTRTINSPLIQSQEEKFEKRELQQTVTNQLFWAALSYKTIHIVRANSRLNAKAQVWLNEGLKRQRTDGSFPEKNGSDTHYQSWSLELLCLYSFYSPNDRSMIQPYLARGFNWLSSKILPDGTMDTNGNTRTGGNQEKDQRGNYKEGRYGRSIPYLYWSHLGGSESARDTATKIANVQKRR